MTDLHTLVLGTAGAVLVLGLFTRAIRGRWWVSESMIAIAIGFLLGPSFTGWCDPHALGDPHTLLEQITRLALAVSVGSAALRLPRDFFKQGPGVWLALGPGMILMWALSTGLVWLILQPPFWVAALIGAVLTPTDPVLAGAIVTSRLAGRKLPLKLRSLISAESGANDGLALPLVLLPLLMLNHPAGEAWRHWFLDTWGLDIAAAIVVGLVLGWLAGWLLRTAQALDWASATSQPPLSVALALICVSAVKLMGSDGILAAFVAALALRNVAGPDAVQGLGEFHEGVQRFFEMLVFLLVGMQLPLAGWRELGGALPLLVLAVLLLRRPPAYLLLTRAMPELPRAPDRVFVSWFGPVGVAALYYAMLALRHGESELVWHVASAVVCGSALIHGLSATPATHAFPEPPS